MQIEGAEAAKYVGKKVYVAGSIVAGAKPAGSASQVVRAVTISAVGVKGKAAAAGAVAGTGTAAAGAAGVGARQAYPPRRLSQLWAEWQWPGPPRD